MGEIELWGGPATANASARSHTGARAELASREEHIDVTPISEPPGTERISANAPEVTE